ncbi:MAG: response regulator, partial [Bacteroidales bacterium]|nr:response regulator [Bacteroidales bacterium]
MDINEYQKKVKVADEEYRWPDKIILVAEDIELNYMYIRELLEPTGAMVVRVENGKKAVDYCINNPKVDMVLMDILMPVMNGYDATRLIKSFNKDIPVIAQTCLCVNRGSVA